MRQPLIILVLLGLFCITCFAESFLDSSKDNSYSYTSKEYEASSHYNAFLGAVVSEGAYVHGNSYLPYDEGSTGRDSVYLSDLNPYLTDSLQPTEGNNYQDLFENTFGVKDDNVAREPGNREDFTAEYHKLVEDFWKKKTTE